MCNDVDINDFTLTSSHTSAPSHGGHVYYDQMLNDLTGTVTPGPAAVSDRHGQQPTYHFPDPPVLAVV
jgi:hypothetical protein